MREFIIRCENNKFTLEGEIVRCKNCRHNNNCNIQFAATAGENFGCLAGEPIITWQEIDRAIQVEPNCPTEEIVQCEDAINRYSALAILDPCSIEYKEIKALPSVLIRSQTRPKGEWIDTDSQELLKTEECSICGHESIERGNFCRYCGADMRVDME